jgi:nicotinamidase-related amidase
MKSWKKITLSALGVIAALIIVIFAMAYWSMRPTTGTPIATYPSPKTALLIIDIQEDYTGPEAKKPYKDGHKIITTSNALLAQVKEKNVLVVFVKNVIDNPVMSYFMGDINAPGAPGTELDKRLIKLVGSKTFIKGRSDAFSNPDLDTYLRENQIGRLLVTGLDAAYCVNATVRGGLNRGYQVVVYSDGIATESNASINELSEKWKKIGAQVKSGSDL